VAVLRNGRHERFVRALVAGESLAAAYAEAGYPGPASSASRLKRRPEVAARIAELNEAADPVRPAVTLAEVTARLLAIAAKGEGSSEVAMLSMARAALMDAAKLNGLAPEAAKSTAAGSGAFGSGPRLQRIERVIVDPEDSDGAGVPAPSDPGPL
jgi:hypothetical protein